MNLPTETDINALQDWLQTYINENCIWRKAPDEDPIPGKLPGTTYTWQFYLRRGLTNPAFLRSISQLFWFQFGPLWLKQPFQIAGLESASTPLVTALVMGHPVCNGLIIRKEPKEYGLKNRFEGIIRDDLPVLLVDDMCNSQVSLANAALNCHVEGLHLYKYAYAIVNKGDVPHDKYLGENIEVISPFKLTDFQLNWAPDHKPWRREQSAMLNTSSI